MAWKGAAILLSQFQISGMQVLKMFHKGPRHPSAHVIYPASSSDRDSNKWPYSTGASRTWITQHSGPSDPSISHPTPILFPTSLPWGGKLCSTPESAEDNSPPYNSTWFKDETWLEQTLPLLKFPGRRKTELYHRASSTVLLTAPA